MDTRRALEEATSWHHRCPECGSEMTGNGTVVPPDDPPRWYVELWCPVDREVFTIWTSDLQDHVAACLGAP